jgi:hypothetical protein
VDWEKTSYAEPANGKTVKQLLTMLPYDKHHTASISMASKKLAGGSVAPFPAR